MSAYVLFEINDWLLERVHRSTFESGRLTRYNNGVEFLETSFPDKVVISADNQSASWTGEVSPADHLIQNLKNLGINYFVYDAHDLYDSMPFHLEYQEQDVIVISKEDYNLLKMVSDSYISPLDGLDYDIPEEVVRVNFVKNTEITSSQIKLSFDI